MNGQLGPAGLRPLGELFQKVGRAIGSHLLNNLVQRLHPLRRLPWIGIHNPFVPFLVHGYLHYKGHTLYNVVMVRLQHVLDSWKAVRQDTIAAVEEFPSGEFDFRPAPELMTFGEAARHILDAGDGLTGLLLAGDENFATPDFRDKIRKHARTVEPGAAGLADALRQSMDQRSAELAAQPASFYEHIITRFDGQQVTRLEMLQAVKEHELTHRAHLFFCLRMKGIVPATTRRRAVRPPAR